MNDYMPYRFGQDPPAPFRNKYYEIANAKFRDSNASNHIHANNPRTEPARPHNFVANKFGLLDAGLGYTITMAYRDMDTAKKDAETLRTWARDRQPTVKVRKFRLTVTVEVTNDN
jgi:hypothetical protein